MSSEAAPLPSKALTSGDRVVITGMGAISALGNTLPEMWDAVLQSRGGLTHVGSFNAGDPRGITAPVKGLNPSSLGVDSRDSRIMGKHSYMLMKATQAASRVARLDSIAIPRDAIAFFAGMGMVDYRVEDLLPAVRKSMSERGLVDFSQFHSEGYKDIHPLWPLSMLNNISFCQVAIALDIQGENVVFSPHAEAGAAAVSEAITALLEGRARVALAAGVSETISEMSLARALLSGLLGPSPGPAVPREETFGSDSTAMGLGEGCGVVVMELLSSAQARGAVPLAVLRGYGSSFQISHEGTGPSVVAVERAMETALSKAETKPEEIDALILDGAPASGGDLKEFEAVQRVFGVRTAEIPALCSKGALGHTLAGAPLIDLVLAASMLRDGVVPASLRIPTGSYLGRMGIVTGSSLGLLLRRVLINCRNCEGHAASLVLEAFSGN